MTTLKTATAGDVGDTRILQLGGVENLEGVVFTANVWSNSHDKTVLDVDLIDADERTIRVYLGGAGGWLPSVEIPKLTEGRWYNIEYQGVSGSLSLTWPNDKDKPDRIYVKASGDIVEP